MRPKEMVTSSQPDAPGFDRTKLRLGFFGIIVLVAFVALFSRLWFLQVLALPEFERLAAENTVRLVEAEKARGRILDRNGVVLVDNRLSLSVTIDRELLDEPKVKRRVLQRLSDLLEVPIKDFNKRIDDGTVSPYKPIAIANDITENQRNQIIEHPEDFPKVYVKRVYVRTFPQGNLAAHLLGYVGEISPEQLKIDYFRDARPGYEAGDIVGKSGLERSYDRHLRGQPKVRQVVVNSSGDVVASRLKDEGEPGKDLILSLDSRVQKVTERALKAGILAARAEYSAPAGGAIVLDPETGGVVAMASFPTYDPSILADGITFKELDALGGATPDDPTDDALLNRPIQAGVPPGSTFKVVTAGAALETGLASPYDYLPCPGSREYGNVVFNNWTSIDYGSIGFPRSLEISCDTFYYELGWRLENAYGAALGDGSERFQDYMHTAGFGQPTGIDLPSETGGVVPDQEWCEYMAREEVACFDGWLPGFSVNMSIGQGDLIVSPIQMAVTYAALVNGGNIVKPHLGQGLGVPNDETSEEEFVQEFEPQILRKLPLDATELGVLRDGLEDVVMGDEGTAVGSFAGFPLDRYSVAGKTGTAQIGSVESGLNYAWFTSYAPADDPQYVVVTYLEQAGHGGESAAPVAREIYEGIFELDNETQVALGSDASG